MSSYRIPESVNDFEYNGRQAKSWVLGGYFDRGHKKVAFVSGADESSEVGLERVAKECGSDTIYTQRGKFPKLDKAWDAYNRGVVAEQRKVLIAAIEALGVNPATLLLKFSRKAGCSCGCSPGFVVDGHVPHLSVRGALYVDVSKTAARVAVEDPSTACATL